MTPPTLNFIKHQNQKAIHIFNKNENLIWAYVRLLIYDDFIILGRVTVNAEYRGNGSGRRLLDYALNYLVENFPNKDVHIVAMSYLRDFYHSLGFKTVSDVYILDDDPHEDMILYRK